MSRQLRIKNTNEAFTSLAEWVQKTGEQFELSEKTVYHLDLILAEAVANIIAYAYPQGGEHWIEIQAGLADHSVLVEIRDDGQPFNPLNYPARPAPASLEDAPVGGLGIHLIRSFSSACAYQRAGQKNILSVTIQNS